MNRTWNFIMHGIGHIIKHGIEPGIECVEWKIFMINSTSINIYV